MKYVVGIVVLLLLFGLDLFSQSIYVKSFKALTNDLDARINFPKKDQNGDLCAIIKVVTTESDFEWDGDALGIVEVVKKASEYWLYVPYGAKRLTIRHNKLGQLRDYTYTESIQKASVYELVLASGKIRTIVEEEEIKTTWLTVKTVPDGADVYINELQKGVSPLPLKLVPGKYTYRIEKSMYHNEAGVIEITGEEQSGKKEIDLTLKPAFGYLKISSLPENGATIFVDDIEVNGKTPFTVDKLKSGKHKVTLKKEMFQPKSVEVVITDGKTTDETLTLSPNFASLSITTQPDADIYIDGSKMGTAKYKGRIHAGVHSFEAKKEKYYSDKKDKEALPGMDLNIDFILQPMYGNIDILSNPIDADIIMDGKNYGKTPITLKKQLIGNYTIKLEKQGYETVSRTVTVVEGKTSELNETLTLKKKEVNSSTTTEVKKDAVNDNVKSSNSSNSNQINNAGLYDSRDGLTYKIVKIGDQTWMAENLNFAGSEGSWCYGEKPINCDRYGRLYNLGAAKTACPSGWHLPSDDEWKTLESSVGISLTDLNLESWRGTNQGDNLKTETWLSNAKGVVKSGFAALPGGYRNSLGVYEYLGTDGYFWTNTKKSEDKIYKRTISKTNPKINRFAGSLEGGYSIRCVKNK